MAKKIQQKRKDKNQTDDEIDVIVKKEVPESESEPTSTNSSCYSSSSSSLSITGELQQCYLQITNSLSTHVEMTEEELERYCARSGDQVILAPLHTMEFPTYTAL